MNQKTAMQQLIDYIDLLNSKNLPEYTLAVAIRLKAIELLEEEKISNNFFNISTNKIIEFIRSKKNYYVALQAKQSNYNYNDKIKYFAECLSILNDDIKNLI